jgi:thioredoxin-dependent peroxiredoxin
MLNVGDTAPEIDATTNRGERFVLSEQCGICTIVYFFPKAFTPGCTVETKTFRDNYVELDLAGASLVGVSTDSLETQCDFARSTGAPFPLIGDTEGAICSAYDVLWPVLKLPQRVTYIIGVGMKIEAVFRHEVDVKAHRDDVLRFVNAKFQSLVPRIRSRAPRSLP